MNDRRSNEGDARPGVDQIPGGASEEDRGISRPPPAGDEQEIHPADGGKQEADRYHGVEDQVPAPPWIEAAALAGQLIPGAPRHAGYPFPVDCQVDYCRGDHGHPAPGVQVIPGLAGEKDLDVIHWVAPALIAARWQEEEVYS